MDIKNLWLKACEIGDVKSLIKISDSYVIPPNLRDPRYKYSSLHLASLHNHLPIVKFLVEEFDGINIHAIDTDGQIPFHLCTKVDVIDYYINECNIDINFKDSINETLLLKLIKKKKFKIVKYVISKYTNEIDFNIITLKKTFLLNYLIEFELFNIFTVLLNDKKYDINIFTENKYCQNITHIAIEKGEEGLIFLRFICEKYCNNMDLLNKKDTFNQTPIFMCVQKGNLKGLKMLIELGNVSINSLNNRQDNIVMYASNILLQYIYKVTKVYESNFYNIINYAMSKGIELKCGIIKTNKGKRDAIGNMILHEKLRKLYYIQQIIMEQKIENMKSTIQLNNINMKSTNEKILQIEMKCEYKINEMKKKIEKLKANTANEMDQRENEFELALKEKEDIITMLENNLHNKDLLIKENNESVITKHKELNEKEINLCEKLNIKVQQKNDQINQLKAQLFKKTEEMFALKEHHQNRIEKRDKIIKKLKLREQYYNDKVNRAKNVLRYL